MEGRLLLTGTSLAVAAASGTYGGYTDLLAHLTSGANNVAGEIVDFQLGGNELGTTTTDANGLAEIDNVSLEGDNVGTYVGDVTAEFTGDVGAGYTASSGANDLTVTAAPLTITANNQTKVYGAALPTLTASYTGFVNGDTSASLATPPTITTTATAASHVAGSPYSITASGAVDTNYAISYVDGSLTVTTAPLTITADNQTKVYGDALPTLTASYTGLVNGDTSASLATPPTITTTATAASHVAGSPYAITASGAVDTDYAISYVAGTLAVTTAPLTITADNQTKVYGDALPTLTASYTGFVNGDTSASLTTPVSLTATASLSSHVGRYSIAAAGAASSDYSISYTNGTLSVTPATLTVTANDAVKPFVGSLPTFSATYSGFVNGDTPASLITPVSLSTTATNTSAPGTYPITASGGSSADYSMVYVDGTLEIQAPVPTSKNGGPVSFVTSLYERFLGRTPEPAGLRYWTKLLSRGVRPSEVTRLIHQSAEAQSREALHDGRTISSVRLSTVRIEPGSRPGRS
ncbi:MAG: MBG domain-containing protein [Isosphaeraceae bacterium]